MENDLQIAIDNWLKAVTEQILFPQVNEKWEEDHKQTYCTLSSEEKTKFVLIVSSSLSSRSAWAFVAKADGYNKQLGNYRKGDIFKPAGYTIPAKHRRGNVFENQPLCNITRWTGPNYMK